MSSTSNGSQIDENGSFEYESELGYQDQHNNQQYDQVQRQNYHQTPCKMPKQHVGSLNKKRGGLFKNFKAKLASLASNINYDENKSFVKPKYSQQVQLCEGNTLETSQSNKDALEEPAKSAAQNAHQVSQHQNQVKKIMASNAQGMRLTGIYSNLKLIWAKSNDSMLFRARSRKYTAQFAVLRFYKYEKYGPKTLRNIEYEVKILNVMRHRNIIHLIDTFYEPELPEIYLAFENCHYSIKDICDMNNTASNRRKLLPEFIANGLARPGMDALEFVHSKGCIHRNVKPSNFLINCKGIIKLADFAMSAYKFSDDDTKNANTYRNSVTGTPHYLAPEIGDLECDEFNQQVYDDKIDSWAFGITLFEIIVSRNPNHRKTSLDLLLHRQQRKFSASTLINDIILEATNSDSQSSNKSSIIQSQILLKLIEALLNPDPKSRLSSKQAKTFIQSTDCELDRVMTIIESEKLFQETINNLNGNGDGRFSFLTAKRRKSRISSAKKFERELKSEKKSSYSNQNSIQSGSKSIQNSESSPKTPEFTDIMQPESQWNAHCEQKNRVTDKLIEINSILSKGQKILKSNFNDATQKLVDVNLRHIKKFEQHKTEANDAMECDMAKRFKKIEDEYAGSLRECKSNLKDLKRNGLTKYFSVPLTDDDMLQAMNQLRMKSKINKTFMDTKECLSDLLKNVSKLLQTLYTNLTVQDSKLSEVELLYNIQIEMLLFIKWQSAKYAYKCMVYPQVKYSQLKMILRPLSSRRGILQCTESSRLNLSSICDRVEALNVAATKKSEKHQSSLSENCSTFISNALRQAEERESACMAKYRDKIQRLVASQKLRRDELKRSVENELKKLRKELIDRGEQERKEFLAEHENLERMVIAKIGADNNTARDLLDMSAGAGDTVSTDSVLV